MMSARWEPGDLVGGIAKKRGIGRAWCDRYAVLISISKWLMEVDDGCHQAQGNQIKSRAPTRDFLLRQLDDFLEALKMC